MIINLFKRRISEVNIISDAGYGDLLYAIHFAKMCRSLNVRIYTSKMKLEFAKFFYEKCYSSEELALNSTNTLFYSDRSNFSASQLFKIFIKGNLFISNSLFERLRITFRLRRFFNKTLNRDFYANLDCLSRFYNDLGICYERIDYNFLRKESEQTKKTAVTLVHAFGADKIRHLTRDQIVKIGKKYNNLKLLGTASGDRIYKEYRLGYDFVVVDDWSKTTHLIQSASILICVDSVIAHLSRFLTNSRTIVLVGNTFAEYYYPQPTSNLEILSNYQSCTPCSQTDCHKVNNKSCIQNIKL